MCVICGSQRHVGDEHYEAILGSESTWAYQPPTAPQHCDGCLNVELPYRCPGIEVQARTEALDVEVLTEALTAIALRDDPLREGETLIYIDMGTGKPNEMAEAIAAEYARLSQPDTETGS